MTDTVRLPGLDGTNPLGFLAALGVLDVLTRHGRDATLGFTDSLVPAAVLGGVGTVEEVVELVDVDRLGWQGSRALSGPGPELQEDLKPDEELAARWAAAMVGTLSEGRAHADLYCGLLSEGAVDGSRKGKPSHLHFTAGQQRFLVMVRELADGLDHARVLEAVVGPWRDDSKLPSLSWDGRGSKPYAVRASDPSKIKRRSVPGADWLAFLGLSFVPVRTVFNPVTGSLVLETSGCDHRWKRSAFRWPLWSAQLRRDSVRTLVGDRTLVGTARERRRLIGPWLTAADVLSARGVMRVLEAPIRRTDQGGYGSFGGSSTIAEAVR